MNDNDENWEHDRDLPELERVLAGLPLREPPTSVDRRVRRVLRRSTFMQQARLVGLGAAAMLVVSAGTAALMLNHFKPLQQPISPGSQNPIRLLDGSAPGSNVGQPHPVLVQHTSSHTSDGGVVGAGQSPLQVLRRQSVQRAWVIDPKTGSRVLITIPREEVMLRRVQTF